MLYVDTMNPMMSVDMDSASLGLDMASRIVGLVNVDGRYVESVIR